MRLEHDWKPPKVSSVRFSSHFKPCDVTIALGQPNSETLVPTSQSKVFRPVSAKPISTSDKKRAFVWEKIKTFDRILSKHPPLIPTTIVGSKLSFFRYANAFSKSVVSCERSQMCGYCSNNSAHTLSQSPTIADGCKPFAMSVFAAPSAATNGRRVCFKNSNGSSPSRHSTER